MSATARSTDGRTFVFEAATESGIALGDYVTITAPGATQVLGQVLAASVERGSGGGEVIAGWGSRLASVGDGASAPDVFVGARLESADPGVVDRHLRSGLGSTAGLEIGTIQHLPEVPAHLQAKGFGRHTFLCGQSGSGKTYTLGVVLERLLLDTDIRLAVLDPNSDYVNLGSVRPSADSGFPAEVHDQLAARYETVAPRVRVFGGEGSANRLRARFGRLSFRQQTRVLGLDPIADAEEYNAFVRIARSMGDDYTLDDVLESVQRSFDAATRRLGLRIDNFGLRDLSIWAHREEPLMERLGDDWRALVADLGSLGSLDEGSIAAAGLLGYLWNHRHERQPVIIVIDEAHNVCPQHPTDASQELATEHAVRIAGEGRKYGLYLLLSTQRPSKIHTQVLSQCDNLLLMKMNSAADLATLSETFSYAPSTLVEQAAYFGLGEGLAAGKIAPDPLLFRSGRRLTLEGGSDVPSTWASARS